MTIIEGPNVDLITPFPRNQLHRIYGWLQCSKGQMDFEVTKTTVEEMAKKYLDNTLSFGVIDKDNHLQLNHPAPMVGYFCFEVHSPTNCFMHFASTRKAWGTRIMDQAVQAGMKFIFDSSEDARRISALVLDSNNPGKGFLRRAGFEKEVLFREMTKLGGELKNMAQYVAFRDKWSYNPPTLRSVQKKEI